MVLLQVMNDPKTFEDPSKFDPERFLTSCDSENGVKFTPHPSVIPFGLGKRRCMGEGLARMELFKFVAGILSQFEILRDGEDLISEKKVLKSNARPNPHKLIFRPLTS